MHKVLDELDAVLWTAARHSFVLPEDQRMPEIKGPLKWEFVRSCDSLAEAMGEGPYLMGETFTIADIVCAHCLSWAINAKFAFENEALRQYLRDHRRPDSDCNHVVDLTHTKYELPLRTIRIFIERRA